MLSMTVSGRDIPQWFTEDATTKQVSSIESMVRHRGSLFGPTYSDEVVAIKVIDLKGIKDEAGREMLDC